MEIERKFRVRELPSLEKKEKLEIEQAYLSRKPVIRIRKQDENYILTVKVKKEERGVLVNREEEFSLTKEEYEKLLTKAEGFVVKKTRYILPFLEGKIELDVFHGRLEGLIFAEIEFSGLEEAKAFSPPSWLGEDVSEDRRFRNTELSLIEEYKEEDYL